ncbi:unnamed protein product [Ilex paraguariensis]|uniref:R13L1/DRL21-like LRR repeat region domain-containing protein n=1 Tax=Ilex paraguariensis TaxID=185542 RepID=A0ABC8TM60_9AQUA
MVRSSDLECRSEKESNNSDSASGDERRRDFSGGRSRSRRRSLSGKRTADESENRSDYCKQSNLGSCNQFNQSNGLGLRDLNSLLHVRGMLSIVGLENVKDARDAEEANLNHKQNLDELELKWGRDVEHSQNEGLQIDVLDMLQPHRKLIGQLPLLKELHIEGMDATKSVGTESYGDGNALKIPFPSLEILRLEEMPEWEEWSIDTGAEVVGNHFPCLRELTMRNCPKLASVSLLRLPSLRKLEIENCREVVLESFSELTTLTSLKIQKILGLTHRHKEFLQFLVSLQVLEIGSCATLVSLWENGITPRDLFRLQRLYIWGCPQLVYLTLSLRDCLALCKLPSNIGNLVNLGHLDNANTGQLQEMPTGIGKLTNLQTLPKIFVGRSNGLGLRDLNSLLHVRGMLSIVGLENVKDARDAEEANLNHKQNLDELELKWGRDVEHSQNEGLQIDVLDMLQPHRKLIGQLPLLKELHIEGMDATKSVGTEFYGDGNALKIPFPSLEILRLEEMPEWEEWSIDTGAEVVGNHFPCLRELTMRNCPKLASVSLLRLPSLRKLEIENCREVVLESFSELTTLTSLKIQKILGLTHRHKEFLQFLVSLQVLEIGSCATLVSLWENGITPRDLFRLQRLYIWGCPQLVYLVEDDQMLPCNLECLEVYTCDRLERLPNGLKDNKSLKELRIRHCPKLESFPDANLPPMLRSLEIGECSALVSVPNCISHLEELELYDCVSLASMPTDTLPSTLRILRISNCGNLESVTDTIEQNKGHWPNLESLSVSTLNFECYLAYQIGQSFPRSGFLTPNLRRLSIRKCANLFSVANQIESLTSLEELRISDCQSLESFPNGNLPPNLKTVYISNCENLKPLSEWGLHRLYSLKRFEMTGVYPELLSFPGKCVFPAALTFLRIGKITNLNSLSMGLQNLTSLKHLEIYNCPNLRSLPNERTLATLSSLTIRDCPLIKQWR